MEDIGNLMQGFAVALTWKNLLFMLVGILLGVLIGVLPPNVRLPRASAHRTNG